MFGNSRNFELEAKVHQLVHAVSNVGKRLEELERSQETTAQYVKEIHRILTEACHKTDIIEVA